jgi:hypothetical protein
METLIELAVNGATVRILRDDDGALTYTPFYGQTQVPGTLTADGVHLMWLDPIVVGGVLPEGITDIAVREIAWKLAIAHEGVWLAVADGSLPDHVGVANGLGFYDADLVLHPIPGAEQLDRERPRPQEVERWDVGPLTDAGRAYATALADALAADVALHGPPGPLRRAVIRWFDEDDPLYITLHVLALADEQPTGEDEEYPVDWANADREFERTDRVIADPALVAAAQGAFPARGEEDEDPLHLAGVLEAARRLPAALHARGIGTSEDFAAFVSHFEGWGAPPDPGP